MKSKIRKTSVSHTLAVDIIDLEEDSDVLDNKCKTSVSPTPEVDIIDLEEDLDDVVNKCLPGSLVQKLVLEHGWTPQKVIDEYKNNILLTADKCKKVYLPMNDTNTHWYLAVILMDKKEVHMVDSLPNVMRHDIRLKAVGNMVSFYNTKLMLFIVR
ncbi:hypothetical protein LINPERPRIM_LOCUS33362 [Linum perenne]